MNKVFRSTILFLFVLICLSPAFGQTAQTDQKEIRYYTQDLIVKLVHETRINMKNEAELLRVSTELSAFFSNFNYDDFYKYTDKIIRKDDPYKLFGKIAETIKWLNANKKKIFYGMILDPKKFYSVDSGSVYSSFVTISMDSARLGVDAKMLDAGLMLISAGITCGGQYVLAPNEKNQLVLNGASLNWLTVSQPMIGMITGGPGGLPVSPGKSVTEKEYDMTSPLISPPPSPFIPDPYPLESIRMPVKDRTDVFILDTLPRMPEILRAYEKFYSGNAALANILEAIGTRHSFVYYGAGDPDFGSYMNEKYGNKNLADHGIFIAGTINIIAPDANLHLIEVMNARASGTLDTLFWGFATVLGSLDSRHPFIVNTSLTTKIRFPGNEKDLPDLGDDFVAKMIYGCPTPEIYLALLGSFVKELGAHNGLVVSAAGNDSSSGARAQAGYPARFPGVMAVGSCRRDGSISSFSNDPGPGGFLAFGGEIDMLGITKEGLLSIYLSSPYTDSIEPNLSGWGRWSGTSFATGVVSGIMALQFAKGKSIADATITLKAACGTSTGYTVVPVKQGP
jgi:hypothetical protein